MTAPDALRAQAEALCGDALCLRTGRVAVYATTQRIVRDWLTLFASVNPRKAARDLGTGCDWYWERRGLVCVTDWAQAP
jgi:hypothetical protein